MLAPRPTKLRSQRDINLWRIPLQLSLAAVALFAITLVPDVLDKYGVIHIPSWLTMGSIDDARAILDDLYVAAGGAHVPGSGEGTGALPDDAAILRQAETGAIVSCPKSGYFQHIDHGALVAAARAVDALIVLRFRPGQFVLRGEPLAAIVPADKAGTLEAAIDRGVHIGRHRTLTQDSEFGIAQVVEIAIRALSPAVNDTFTGF